MGASLDYRTYDDSLGQKQILATFNADCEDSRYESGHSYSGEIGMLYPPAQFQDKQFPTRNEASKYLCDNHEKWDAAMAISFFDENKQKRWMIGGWCSS